MRILMTGATGFIGSAVAQNLLAAGHEVAALARSAAADDKITALGARPIRGMLGDAPGWLPDPAEVDAVVHTAATFASDMAEQEAAFLLALVDWSGTWTAARGGRLPLVYTGGCWLYGSVGDDTAVEGTPFDPLPAFAFMVDHRRRLLAEPGLDVRIVHPAMVWDDGAGVIGGFFEAAWEGMPPQVVGPHDSRWPLVHRQDLARLYRLVLERGAAGTDYHGVAETGVPVGEIAAALAKRCRAPTPVTRPVDDAVAELGDWAAGYALDQTMDAPHTRQALGWRPDKPTVIEAILNG